MSLGPTGPNMDLKTCTFLQQWIREGRVSPSTQLVEEDSFRALYAREVLGLFEGTARDVDAPGSTPLSPYPRQSIVTISSTNEDSLVITAYVLSALGPLLILPLIGPIIGCFLARRAQNAGHPSGKSALIFSLIILLINGLLCVGCFAITLLFYGLFS